jgi:hypothetical protein
MYGEDPDHASYYYGNYDANHGTIRISDEMILMSPPFDGWHREFLKWDKGLWRDPGQGVPCEEPEKNAYHIRWLSEQMVAAGGWVGGPLSVRYGTRGVMDGSHRHRAWRYLATAHGVVYEVPVASHVFRAAGDVAEGRAG